MATAPPAPAPPPAPPAPPPRPALTEPDKPGYMTTEFWITVLSLVGCFGVTFFHWSPQQNDQWGQLVSRLAPLVAMLVSFLLSNQYCTKRNELKKTLAAVASGAPLVGVLPDRVRGAGPAVALTASEGGVSGSFTTADGTVVKVQNGRIMQIG